MLNKKFLIFFARKLILRPFFFSLILIVSLTYLPTFLPTYFPTYLCVCICKLSCLGLFVCLHVQTFGVCTSTVNDCSLLFLFAWLINSFVLIASLSICAYVLLLASVLCLCSLIGFCAVFIFSYWLLCFHLLYFCCVLIFLFVLMLSNVMSSVLRFSIINSYVLLLSSIITFHLFVLVTSLLVFPYVLFISFIFIYAKVVSKQHICSASISINVFSLF